MKKLPWKLFFLFVSLFKVLRLFVTLWYNSNNLDVWSNALKKSYRVKREKDFQAIFETGQNVANRKFVIYFLEKNQAHFRVGISVGKRLGNAVTRNAVKRKVRHVLIANQDKLKNYDFVVIARKGVEELDFDEVKKNLEHALRLAKLYQEGLEE